MKSLLFLSTVYPTPWEAHKGPANITLITALRELGCNVSVIAPVPWPVRLRQSKDASVSGAEYPTYWYTPGFGRARYDRAMQWSLRGALQRAMARSPAPAAVLAFWTHPDGAVAVAHGQRAGIRSGVIAAGSDVMLLPNDPSRREVVSHTLRSADHVFGVGSAIVQRSIALGADPSRVSNFVQGVNLQRFGPGDRAEARRHLGIPADGPLLLWVGNMVPVKAAERVILAARVLAESMPGLRVVMIGKGPAQAALQQLANESGALASRIVFPGPIASAELASWYHAANVLVLPSRSEGMPNVLLEAMATGLPFVASQVGSIADLLPFGPSRVVTEGSMTELQDAIRDVLGAGEGATEPRRIDILDGAREVIRHLQLESR